MSQHEQASTLHGTTGNEATDSGKTRRRKERSFFEHMQPTFAIEVPRTTKLEFLDERNPEKGTIVRKKAREWVNQNKANSKKIRQRWLPQNTQIEERAADSAENQTLQVQRTRSSGTVKPLDPLRDLGVRRLDPFNVLPEVGTDYNHLLDYFLRGCPGQTPCLQGKQESLVPTMNTTDEYAHKSRHSIIPFASADTILRELGQSEVTFALFLYSVVCIREGVSGRSNLAELYSFYNDALHKLRKALDKEMELGVYSDNLLLSLSVIAAIACFTGMFDIAVIHRNALIRVLEIRGDGDVLNGVQTTSQWTKKAIQWLEILIAIQLVETPRIPYLCTSPSTPLCPEIVSEAQIRTTKTLSHFPNLIEPLQYVILLLHQLAAAYNLLQCTTRTDVYIIRPLYDAQYTLLQILETHKNTQNLSDMESLLAESFQLYFAIGPRAQPPQMRLLDLLVARIKTALIPFLGADLPSPQNIQYPHDDSVNDAIAFGLALGTLASAWLDRPEFAWYQAHIRACFRDWDEDRYKKMLDVFPPTEGYGWLDMGALWMRIQQLQTWSAEISWTG